MALAKGQRHSNEILGFERPQRGHWQNPYKGEVWHPVEQGFQDARLAICKSENIKKFKEVRDKALMYLERQYLWICDASTNLVEFIKVEKKLGGYYDIDMDGEYCEQCWKSSQAILLVQNYANSFKRESPMSIRADIFRQQRWFDSLYHGLPGAKLFLELDNAWQFEKDIRRILRSIIDDLDDQLIEIRLARKELFRWEVDDMQSFMADTHKADPICAENICWDIREPELGPPNTSLHDSDIATTTTKIVTTTTIFDVVVNHGGDLDPGSLISSFLGFDISYLS